MFESRESVVRVDVAKPKKANISSALETQFKSLAPLAEHFASELTRQLQKLLDSRSVVLSFPIQQRVKTWSSLAEKLERKALSIKTLTQLDDFVGLRLILQFTRDASKVCRLIGENFKVIKSDDTAERLGTDQFGYSSVHFVVALPDSWLAVPSFSQMKGWRAEIQVRTTAQHIWAAASHTLQYKREDSVPASMRRGIHRVSALLELIDLEFERLLAERDTYREGAGSVGSDVRFDVDLLENALDGLLPAENKQANEEDYAELLEELNHFKVVNRRSLQELIGKRLAAALIEDRKRVSELRDDDDQVRELSSWDRQSAGVYFTHVGLVRCCLGAEFGEEYHGYQDRRARRNTK